MQLPVLLPGQLPQLLSAHAQLLRHSLFLLPLPPFPPALAQLRLSTLLPHLCIPQVSESFASGLELEASTDPAVFISANLAVVMLLRLPLFHA